MEKIEKGDLYALLSICTKEELDPLVKCITSKLSNFLEINDDYKRYQPDHTKYHRVIADEIRLYGGNTVMNLKRGREGPPYDEVLRDVCKKLDVPCRLGETLKNESNLLTIYLTPQWATLGKEEVEEHIAMANFYASTGVGWNALDGYTNAGALLKKTLGGVLRSTVLKTLDNGVTDPNFSVTIPCILRIAYLRKRYLNAAAKETPAVVRVPAAQRLVRSKPLVVGISADAPVLSLARISEPPVADWKVANDADGISRLNPLLQAVPSLATAGEVAGGTYMEVVINGDLLKAKGQEGYRLIAMIDGKPSHGTLLNPDALSNIVNTSAMLNVASVALAQKHLADISRKLSEIKASVDRILAYQQNERRAVMKGSISYFEQVTKAVLSGELSKSVRHQIEHHEAQLLQAQVHLMGDIRSENQKILNLKDETMLGSKGMEDAIRGQLKRLDDLYDTLLLCIRARACGWQLLSAYPSEECLKESRRQSVGDAIEALAEDGELLSSTVNLLRQKVRSMSAVCNFTVTVNERKLSLLESADLLGAEIVQRKEQLVRDMRDAEVFMDKQPQPVTMLVKIESGQIVATCPAI